jgi:phosphoribosyl 1,2-cyclic phosphate phosphodiesterase
VSQSVTILGCGSSGGVPRVAQGWGKCDPLEPRNRRRRCSILVKRKNERGDVTNVLVDTSPDLREQILSANVLNVDGVLFTHDHADHTHGIDDLRPFYVQTRKRMDVWIDPGTSPELRNRFSYVFESRPGSDYPPILNEHHLVPGEPVSISGPGGEVSATAFRLPHGNVEALGLRFGNMAYTPDVSAIPKEALEHLKGLDLWIIDALRIAPHPSHFTLQEALGWIEQMKPKRAVLTNLHTDLDYHTLRTSLPEGVEAAYDGLTLDFE